MLASQRKSKMTSTTTKLPAPAFGGEKSFEQYMMEKKDQAVILALSLPVSREISLDLQHL